MTDEDFLDEPGLEPLDAEDEDAGVEPLDDEETLLEELEDEWEDEEAFGVDA
jgi:hypothetical protein